MAKTEYFELGTLSKPHGLKGAFHLYLDVDDPYDYEDLDAIFLQQGNEMVPYFVEDIQIRDNLNLITLEIMDSELNQGDYVSVNTHFENQDLSLDSIEVSDKNKYRFINPLNYQNYVDKFDDIKFKEILNLKRY
jgi:hypothetical protein